MDIKSRVGARRVARGQRAIAAGDKVIGHLAWLTAAPLVGFSVSFGGVAVAALPRNAFVLIHVLVTGVFLGLYARWAGLGPADLGRNRRRGLALGLLAAVFSVHFVLTQPASPGLAGLDRVLAVMWLGIVYGLIDALLLTIVPVYSVWRIAGQLGWRRGWSGQTATAVLALMTSLIATVAYHLGFPEFRGAEVMQPLIGNAVITAAYILSGSPLAPLLAHVALHTAAVLHAYAASIPLPPHY